MKVLSFIVISFFAISLSAQTYELSEVDAAPVFAKGKMNTSDFLRYYLTYPQSEYDKGVEGTVTLQYTVDSLGTVKDVKIKHSLSPLLDQEALRLASMFPYYTPAQKDGRDVDVNILFPVKFQLENSKVVANEEDVTVESTSDGTKNPLYVVDDKVLEEDSNIDPSTIKKIRIVKGQKAIDLYGSRAKDGLILIETY